MECEKHFFGTSKPTLYVEHSAVCDKCFKSFLVVASQPVNGVSAEACAYGSSSIFIDKWFVAHVVDCRQVVAHALPTVVARDGIVPLLPEAWQSAPIWSNDNVSFCCHELEVPTVRKKLAHGALWSALAIE